MKPFMYCVVLHPTKKGLEDGEKPQLISELKVMMANDEKSAAIKASRAIDQRYENEFDRVEIFVRPF